jgi:hypothetical protein
MNIKIIVFIQSIILFSFLLVFINNNEIKKNTTSSSNNNTVDISSNKILLGSGNITNCNPEEYGVTIEQLKILGIADEIGERHDADAHLSAAKYSCVTRGYGFDCNGFICKCTINNKDQCETYAREIIDPVFYDISTVNDNKNSTYIYWDSDNNKCIETIKQISSPYMCDKEHLECTNRGTEEESCATSIKSLDDDARDFSFEFVPPKLQCFDTPFFSYCKPLTRPSCRSEPAYCSRKGLDYREVNGVGQCYVSGGQEIAELIFGQDLTRCTRTGDLDCILKSVNIPMMIADIICAKAFNMDGGCGIPRLLPSVAEIVNFFENVGNGIADGFEKLAEYMVEGFEKGIEATKDFFVDMGFTIGEAFEQAWGSSIDFLEDIAVDVKDFFITAADFTVDVVSKLGCA